MSKSLESVPPFDPVGYNSTETLARHFRVSASFLNKARCTGDGPPFVRIGSAIKYHGPTVTDWAAKQTRRSTSDQGEAA